MVYLTVRSFLLNIFTPLTPTYTCDDLHEERIRKLLVIRLDKIGDMVATTPIFRAIKEGWTHVHISVLVNPVNREIIVNNPFIDDILIYDKSGNHRNPIKKFLFFQQLSRMRFDIVIDPYLDYELKTAIITRLIGKRYRLGFTFSGKELFYNIRQPLLTDPVSLNKKHMTDSLLDLIGCLGIKRMDRLSEDRRPQIFLTKDEKKRAKELLQREGIDVESVIVGIHPGGHFATQRWPVERFAEVSEYLITHHTTNVILFGGGEDSSLISEFQACASRKPIILSDLALRDFMATLSYCTLFLCNNSGPLHIATALNIPTVSTMGPTDPSRWWPQGDDHLVLRKNLECSPCNRGSCKNHECMRLITTDDYLSAVKKQLRYLSIAIAK